MNILVTGTAGFIGSHVAHVLLTRGEQAIGFDNLSESYYPALKQSRLQRLLAQSRYTHVTPEFADRAALLVADST